jgi:AraC family transcriptional regulator, transcriptional activator of pobA
MKGAQAVIQMKAGGPKPAGRIHLRILNPRRGDVAFQVARGNLHDKFAQPQRSNSFTVMWIQDGSGHFHSDVSRFSFRGPALLFANPYQKFFLEGEKHSMQGAWLQFHANFFCVETHHAAVGCNGVLFNDIYGEPLVNLKPAQAHEFEGLISEMEQELQIRGLAHAEALLAILKVFLIKATRLKLTGQEPDCPLQTQPRPAVLKRLIHLIERDFRTKHSPAAYAAALNMTTKALGKLVKVHLHRTLTQLIQERVLKHAKWQMLHTQRPVKEVAWEAGFVDEYYFSRLFKRATGLSPTAFRAFETAIRSGGHLSS